MPILDLSGKDASEILANFKKLDEMADIRRIVCTVWGNEKEGKTHFGFTSSELVPENPYISEELRQMLKDGAIISGSPLFVICTEGKAKKMKKKFAGRDIRILEVWSCEKDKPAKLDVKKSLKNLILAIVAMSEQTRGTLLIDSWTDVNKWARKYIQTELVDSGADDSKLGELIPLQASDYEVRGDIVSFLLYYIQNYIPNMHVIMTVRAKNKWKVVERKGGKSSLQKTGEVEKSMYADTAYFSDIEVRVEKIEDDDGNVSRIGTLLTSEYDAEEPVKLDWDNPTFPKVVDSIKDLAFKAVKAVKPNPQGTFKKSKKPKPDVDNSEVNE
jgi:hypothetical protein